MKNINYLGYNMPILPWMINFDCPKSMCFKQERSTNAKNQLEYQANLSINAKCANYVLTVIMCSLGINNSDPYFIEKLLKENIRAVCIDISVGTETDHLNLINTVRDTVQNYSDECGRVYPFAIALELTGLRIRTGNLDSNLLSDILLEENHIVYVTTNDNYDCHCNKNVIFINYKELFEVLSPSNLIYIDYGTIILEVLELGHRKDRLKCKVINGGKLKNQAIIHLPNIPQSLDRQIKAELITFALKNEVDALIISQVNNAHVIESIRDLLGPEGNSIMLIAKIENVIAVEKIDEIIEVSDAIIIARGELGMELPPEKLFIVQKSLIAKCNKAGKPVICGGHLLKSMYKNLLPTRAEMLDAANVILDGTDGIIISEEIINSLNIYHAIHSFQNICIESETAVYQKQVVTNLLATLPDLNEPAYSIAISAVDASTKCNAACIIVQTVSGRSAKLVAQYRPQCPIIAITRYGHVARKLNLWRGIIPIQFTARPRENYIKETDARFQYAITFGKFTGLIKGGNTLVLVSGWKECAGFTNTVRIVYASQNNCTTLRKKKCNQ